MSTIVPHFVCTGDVPEKIDPAKELVVNFPDFVDEIKQAIRTKNLNQRKLTNLSQLKEIASIIGSKYDPNNFTLTSIPYARFQGIEYKDEKELSDKVIVPMFKQFYPSIFRMVMEQIVINRRKNVEMIYYTGPYDLTGAFTKFGISEISIKELKSQKKNAKVEPKSDE